MNKSVLKPSNSILSPLKFFVREIRKIKIKLSNPNKKINFGNNCYIGSGSHIYVPQFLIIDNFVAIAGNLTVQTNLHIGAHSLISSNVSFIGHDHDVKNSESAFFSGRNEPSTIYLKGNNFIGYSATILGNITVGEGAIIGAHSLVIKDVEPYTIVAGVPAKVIGNRVLPVN